MYTLLLLAMNLYPEGIKIECLYERQFMPERDTIIATHWHQSNGRVYVITKDKTEIWCDGVKIIEQKKEQ